jgi:phenylalanyl-tRNA synthetase alpha chain
MPNFLSELEPLKQAALVELQNATDLPGLDQAKGTWIGPQGRFTNLMRQLATLPKEERPAAGKAINAAKIELEQALLNRRTDLESRAALPSEPTDFSAPGRRRRLGRLHPLTQVTEDIVRSFR